MTSNGSSTQKLKYHCRPKIWVNAAPFGFGPAAIVFNLFPQLKKLVSCDNPNAPVLEYVGSGLSLDFIVSLPWDFLHQIDVHEPGGRDKLRDLYRLQLPILIVTVLDIPFAEILVELGAKVVIIDSLLWYWKSVPDFYKHANLLLVPNFVGVRERIKEMELDNAILLPAMMPYVPVSEQDTIDAQQRKGTLVNLGGLQTPFSALSENVKYARCMLEGLQCALQQRDCEVDWPITALVSDKVRRELQAEFQFLQTTTPYQARRLLQTCRTAFMTSGMGNVLDAVDYGDQVVFLPAICKSHGLQLELLRVIGIKACVIDWQDVIVGKSKLDYTADDASCFKQVEQAQAEFLNVAGSQDCFVQRCINILETKCADVRSLKDILKMLGRASDTSIHVQSIVNASLGFQLE